MSSYHNDAPILGSKESPDLLNRENFAERLAELMILKEEQDCLTISLEGEWGYGKTSLINLIKKSLKTSSEKPVIVEFNPWMAGSADVLVQDFLIQFSAQLDIPDRPQEVKDAAKQLLSYSKLFNVLKLIPGAEPWASIVKGVVESVGVASEDIGKLTELNLLERKYKVRDSLVSLKRPIIVIIDDIDRLTPEEAFQVIRLVKAVADFPRTTFILAFDPEYVASALEKRNISRGSLYLDKVIQLRIPIPIIGKEDMHKLANSELSSLSKSSLTDRYPEDQERLGRLYWQYSRDLIKTPRELKRIFNHLRLAIKQTYGEVCFTDLYALSILAIKAPEVYKLIRNEPRAFVGKGFSENVNFEKQEDTVKSYKKKREEVINQYQNDTPILKKILEEIFPLTCDSDFNFGSTEYDKNGRVASPKRLYVALHYQVPTGYASENEVYSLIKGVSDRRKILKDAIDKNSIERLFDFLHYNSEKVEENQKLPILKDFYDVLLPSDYLRNHLEGLLGVFTFNPFRNLIWLTFDFIEKSNYRYSIIKELFEDENYLPITADILRRIMVQHGDIKTDDPRLMEVRWVEKNELAQLKTIWVEKALSSFCNRKITESVLSSHVYYVLEIADIGATKSMLNTVIQKKTAAEEIARIIGRCGTDSTGGPYVKIEESDFLDILDFKKLKDIVQLEIDSDKDLAPFFKAVYQSILTGKQFYLNDGSAEEEF